MAKEYIDREAAINTIFGLYTKVDDDGYVWVLRGDAVKAIDLYPGGGIDGARTQANDLQRYGGRLHVIPGHSVPVF